MNPQKSELKQNRWYYLKWIFRQYKGRFSLIALLLLLTVLSTVISVLVPIVFKKIIDALVENLASYQKGSLTLTSALSQHHHYLLLILALGLGSWVTGFYPFLRGRTNALLEMAFREKYFGDILEKGHGFFMHFRTGDLVTRLTEDVRNYPPGLSWLCCSGIFRAANSSCIIFFCLLSMCWLNLKLTLVAIIPLPFLLWLFFKLETTIERRFKKLQEGKSEANDFLEAVYSGVKIVKSFNAEEPQARIFQKLMERRIDLEMDVIKIDGLMHVYFEFLNYIGQVLVLLFGGIMVVQKHLSIGEYYAFFSYMGMIVFPLIDIPMMFVTLAQSFVAIDRLEEITEHDIEFRDETSGDRQIDEIDSIEFRNVAFSFSHSCKTAKEGPSTDENFSGDGSEKKSPSFKLRELSFTLKSGEKLAVVGRIGAGKTTLLNLTAGIIAPSSGAIFVNGLPLSEISKSAYRAKVGYIQQEPAIFSTTVESNINFWRGNQLPWVEECARLAQLEQEIRGFPHGFQEEIGQRGVTLSGGQKQRLSIARALAGKPQILLMDDITSSLDSENELRLWKELYLSFPHLTCMIVTHRLSSAQNADRIMVLENGNLVAIDTHKNLLSSNEIYQELAQR